MIFASRRDDRVRVGLLRGDLLAEFHLWTPAAPDGVGDVYTGRVDAKTPALAGAFVELGGVTGFLPDSAGAKSLTEGAYVTVRVTRAPQGGKGPRLETLAEPPGEKPGLTRRGPGPLLDLAARCPGAQIRVDDYALIADLRPALEGRLHFGAIDAVLEDELAALAEPTAPLPGGATLQITPAPAATLLDIDSPTPSLAANTALIPELCRQIALRNLSGGLLVDFAGLKPAQRTRLAPALSAALAADPLKPTLLGFSHLGFAEINRRRIRPPLHEVLQ
jgi:Ribonuclease G/E